MHTVYLDNFRGFQNNFTILTPVSFLVGENSSGKTSFLTAVELLSSFTFWADPSFNKAGLNLGSFQDIVSLNSERRDYFTLGWFYSVEGQEKETSVFALLTFRERGNRPSLFRYSFLLHDSVVKIQYSPKKIAYKIEKLKRRKRNYENLFKLFCRVAKSHKSRLGGLQSIDNVATEIRHHRSPFFGPMSFIKGFSSKKKQTSILSPVLFAGHELTSIAPIRTKPQPIYDAFEADVDNLGGHTPYILRRELKKSGKSSKLRDALRKFGKESGLFRDVQVHSFGDRGGSSVSGTPFEIGIVLEKRPINMPFVGYGVSQVLPIAVDIFSGKENQVYIVQQPEVHLHPRAQAAFGDLIFASSLTENRWFLIETHSDFLIDRFRLAMSRAKKRAEKPLSSVIFFERSKGFNSSKMILIDPRGKYMEKLPEAFREFFLNENIDLLDI